MNRPYLVEKNKQDLRQSIEYFSRGPDKNKKPLNKKKIIYLQERLSDKQTIKMIIAFLIIISCFAFSVGLIATVSERNDQVNILRAENIILQGQNEKLEYTLLSDIDGQTYKEFITQDLHMSKSQNQEYINVQKYKEERNGSNEKY